MPANLKIAILIFSVGVLGLFYYYSEEEPASGRDLLGTTQGPLVIAMYDDKIDTVYLNTYYQPPVAEFIKNGRCCTAEISGEVNTAVTGTYFVDYDGHDDAGHRAATVTRTVHVVENSAAFLNGLYNVACTCTARSSTGSTLTTDDYIASVGSGTTNNYFSISQMRIGSEYVMPLTSLKNNSAIDVSYFHCDYNYNSLASGTLSADKRTFTIESSFSHWPSGITYECKNVFTNSKAEKDPRKDLASQK